MVPRVTEKDRRHMARLGAALDAELRERRRRSALEPPGAKIERGLRMSDELLAHTSPLPERAKSFSLPALWKARRAARRPGVDLTAT